MFQKEHSLAKDNNMPKKVTIIEVGPRDGLQNLEFYIETSKKISLINTLSKTGLERIEITSFVHPKAVPQFKDASEVVEGIEKKSSVIYYVLVPNLIGAVRAFKSGAKNLNFVISASEMHNKRNVNRTIGESLEEFRSISNSAKENGVSRLKVSVATAYGCPFEGEVSSSKVIDIVAQLQELEVTEIALCDTAGMASPVQIASLISAVQEEFSGIEISVHFHAEKERGLINISAAFEAGVTLFEGSIGGLGGCPFVPDAIGNIPTEDMISMFEERGICTGVDLRKFANCRALMQAIIKKDISEERDKQSQ